MRFGVLGPLAAWTADGKPVAIPGLKVRALLAALLVHEGKPVSADRLVDDLWGDMPPANPHAALQVKVSQLRRALDDAEPGSRRLVVSRSPGYQLMAEGLDADRFRSLTTLAGKASDPRTRTTLLTDALELWRGPALADFADEMFAQPLISRLEEDRLTALEEQIEARLELGGAGVSGLVGEVGELVARHPLRERLRAAHMRALYNAGRQVEALESFTELRNRLAEELSLDPGPVLVALQRAILAQDPKLGVPTGSAPRPRGNLPAAAGELVGRSEELARVRSLLEENRAVTLTGSGGVGKTRLAVETATRLADSFADGVWLVELAAVSRTAEHAVELLAGEILAALGIREDTAAPADRLVDALRDREVLLLLDNCEHVVEPVAVLTGRLVREASRLRVLVTSQEGLSIAGEALHRVQPLGLPDQAVEDVALLERSSAVRLFVARAAAASPGFTLTPDNARDVAVLCRRLDGIPLALELAANRVRSIGVHGLVDRLDDRFRLLATGYRGAPPRQQTLRAVIDWSWELLNDDERVVLCRLSAHAEGCTLEAAEAVCAGGTVSAEQVMNLLARLVDRSLVVTTEGAGELRYRLLESVAQYCMEQLRDSGELDLLRQRHRDYYVGFAERAEPHLYGHEQRRWLGRLDREAANFRAVLEGAVRDGAGAGALRLVNALSWYWFLRGRLTEARLALSMALTTGPAPDAIRARALAWQVGLAVLAGHATERSSRIQEVLSLYAELDDHDGRARAQWFLDYAMSTTGDLEAGKDLVDKVLAQFRAEGDQWGVAAALSVRANKALARGDLETLRRDGERSAALFRELGDRWGQAQTVYALASVAEIAGDYERAAALQREGLAMAEELGLWPEASERLAGLGRIALLTGDWAGAREFHERAMRLAVEQGYKAGEVFAEIGLALVARREGRLDAAEAHLRRLLDWNREANFDNGVGYALVIGELGFVAEHRGDARQAATLHLDGYAAAQRVGDLRAVALALEGLAGAQALAGRHDLAAVLLGAAAAARQSVGAPLPAGERWDVDRITAAAREALGVADFDTGFTRGAALSPDAALSLVDSWATSTR